MKRRKFITLAVLGGVSIASIGYFVIDNFLQVVKKMLLEDIFILKIEKNTIDRFISDAVDEQFFYQFSIMKKILIIAHYKLGALSFLLPYNRKYYQYRGAITGQFLMSTNIFSRNRENSDQVLYIAYFNPFKRPCANVYSDIYYPNVS